MSRSSLSVPKIGNGLTGDAASPGGRATLSTSRLRDTARDSKRSPAASLSVKSSAQSFRSPQPAAARPSLLSDDDDEAPRSAQRLTYSSPPRASGYSAASSAGVAGSASLSSARSPPSSPSAITALLSQTQQQLERQRGSRLQTETAEVEAQARAQAEQHRVSSPCVSDFCVPACCDVCLLHCTRFLCCPLQHRSKTACRSSTCRVFQG